MAKDHGPSVKDDKQYEALRKRGMSGSIALATPPTLTRNRVSIFSAEKSSRPKGT